uniref:Uncharacterized protein n=1 Tax=Oryza punctata TaxID=4537 RepID=A0A0E0LTW4_ORYPU
MADVDRISDLSDDLLLHILSSLHAKEAAATTVLSRRWRPVWRRTCVLNLYYSKPFLRYYNSSYNAFLRFADGALAAVLRRGDPALKKLSLVVDSAAVRFVEYNREVGKVNKIGAILSHPAAAGLQDLHVDCLPDAGVGVGGTISMYELRLASLPCAATLRVLHLAYCCCSSSNLAPPSVVAFPSLTDLAMTRCKLSLSKGHLQTIVDAAPRLAVLRLDRVHLMPATTKEETVLRLRCPTVTTFVLVTTVTPTIDAIELDAPSLRSLSYDGYSVPISLTSPAPNLALVDLDISRPTFYPRLRQPVWRVLGSLGNAAAIRAMTLHVYCIDDMLDGDGGALPVFPNLVFLHLEGQYLHSRYQTPTSLSAMANLLKSCPAVSELRLRLTMKDDYDRNIVSKKQRLSRRKSGNSIERMESSSNFASKDEGVHDLKRQRVSEPAFDCLEKTLRKVTMRFRCKEMDSFPVHLTRLLVENAMALEELHVDDTAQFFLNNEVEKWRADSFHRRNLPIVGRFEVKPM